ADETEVLELDGPVTGMTEAESEHLHRRILRSVAKERTRRLSWIRYAAAAMLLIGLAYAGYYWNAQPDEHMADVQTIVPGGNRAVLTLGDGQTLELSENQEEIVVNDQQLIYADGSEVVDLQAVAANEQRSTLLTVTTPKGG